MLSTLGVGEPQLPVPVMQKGNTHRTDSWPVAGSCSIQDPLSPAGSRSDYQAVSSQLRTN